MGHVNDPDCLTDARCACLCRASHLGVDKKSDPPRGKREAPALPLDDVLAGWGGAGGDLEPGINCRTYLGGLSRRLSRGAKLPAEHRAERRAEPEGWTQARFYSGFRLDLASFAR